MGLLSNYRAALRDEVRGRNYLLASLIDDVGTVIAAWATLLMVTNLLTSQRERAKLIVPSLLCLLAGTIISGPLADWAPAHRLARWRWRLVVFGRLLETMFLGVLALYLATGEPTLSRVMPYILVSGFMKTALRPTRVAFAVDLLQVEKVQTDPAGHVLQDERGEPLRYKVHLLAISSLTGALSTAASLTGLLVGGWAMRAAGGRYWPLFAADVVTNVAFVVAIGVWCRPTEGAPPPKLVSAKSGVIRHFTSSAADAVKFLGGAKERPLLCLMLGALLVELISEAYDGKMIVRHVLGGSADSVRYAEIGWRLSALVVVAGLPLAMRWIGSIGKIFFLVMFLDSIAIAIAGGVTAASAFPVRIAMFAVAGGVDHSLTLISSKLTELAQASASSPKLRGRIDGLFVLSVVLGAIGVEYLATYVSEAIGIPRMLIWLGFIQLAAVAAIAALGGRRLWRFGLFAADETVKRTTADTHEERRPSLQPE